MFGSLNLGKLFGIDLYVHSTFWLLPLLVLFQTMGAGLHEIAFQLAFVFAVFGCVVLHEIGHALAARAYGIGTRHITLYPIGGVAALERMPEKPLQEVVVALAGPAVNVVIAIALFFGLVATGTILPEDYETPVVVQFAEYMLGANVLLCLFNLLPAFPMDGGRVLRALLAIRMTRLRATQIAVKVGTVVAIGLVIAGIAPMFLPGLGASPSFNLIFVAIVVWLLGQAELGAIRIAEARKEYERRAGRLFEGPEVEADAVPASPTADTAADLAARRFSGLAWDAERRVWVQWINGVPVRDIPT